MVMLMVVSQQLKINKSVSIINSQAQKQMDFSSRNTDTKQYTSVALRQNYNSNNMSKYSTPTQIVDQLRKKYDTPTRRDLKDIQIGAKSNISEKGQLSMDYDLKKSVTSGAGLGDGTGRDRWTGATGRTYDMSPMYKKENVVGEEETIFRKIKEMKDSLLNKNEKIKTTKSIYQPRMSEKPDARPLVVNDNRVENIDKINCKIQQILSCLKETQNKNTIYDTNDYKNQLKSSSKMTVDNSNKSYCLTRSSQYQQIKGNTYQNSIKESKTTFDRHVEVKNTTSIYQQDKKYKIESPVPKNVQNFDLGSNRGENSKVRSFISSIQKQTGVTNNGNKYEMKSGKKLDDEISKIELKIQQFEDEKRKLNIDFKPYSYSNSKSTANLTRRSYTIDKHLKPAPKLEVVQSLKKTDDYSSKRTLGGYDKYSEKRLQEKYVGRISFQPTRPKNIQIAPIQVQISSKHQRTSTYDQQREQASSLFKLKLIPVEAPEKERSSASSRVENRMLSEDLRKRTDQGILDRKNKLKYEQSSRARPTIKRLVEKLSEQTNLDEKLRNNKLYFESNMENNKWEQLEDELKRNGIRMDREKMKKLFKVTDEQNNPFFSVRESQSNIETLAKSYAESQQHWTRQLAHTLRKQDLINQQFSSTTLDLQKKGYIVLEDIVRFLNMETGTFYRNRDLFLIFRRMSEDQKVSFDHLMATFCK